MRIDLNIAFEEKDVAKQNGARWDRVSKKWYLESNSTQELSTKLNKIASTLGKKVEDIAFEISKKFAIENAKDYINQMLALNGMKEGTFPDNKPEDAKTITGWLKEGYIPISLDVIKTYEYSGKENVGYQYIAKENVKPMTNEEKQAYEEVAAERRSQASKKAAEKRNLKKLEKLQEKVSAKDSSSKVVEKEVEIKLDAFQSFIELKGLSEEFDKFYNKYYSQKEHIKEKEPNDNRKICDYYKKRMENTIN